MKKLMIIVAILTTMCASAANVEKLIDIPAKDVTAANAAEVLDAAIATTNLPKIAALVKLGKVSLEDAVHKTMALKPLSMCEQAFNNSATTNHALQAEALAQLDYTKLDEKDFRSARLILFKCGFFATEAGLAEAARIAEASIPYGAMVYCTGWYSDTKNAYASIAPAFYTKAKPYVKNSGSTFFMKIMIWYGYWIMKDYDSLSQIYNKDLMTHEYYWLDVNTVDPNYMQYMKDKLAIWKIQSKNGTRDNVLLNITKTLDRAARDKTATINIIDEISCSKTKLYAALYCNSGDKMIDVFITSDTSLNAKDISNALPLINALDPDYRKADVLKALRAVNQRYTLKLYDDRDTWEPVLSKIRAMIDCRTTQY